MKRNVMRVFSMLLALVMLLGMAATAETEKITFEVNGPNGRLVDGILSVGFDEDGCEQYSLESSMLGKWLLQSDGVNLVFGGDQMGGYLEISADDLSQALNNVMNAISMQDMTEEDIALMNYMNSPAYQADVEAATLLLAGELNRIASIAQEMGLVTIYENGDLVINVERSNLLQMAAAYLNALASDEAVLSDFAGLEIFKVYGLDMASSMDSFVSEIKNVAREIEQMRLSDAAALDGYFKLSVSAETGAAIGEYYMADLSEGVPTEEMKMAFTYDGVNLKMDVHQKMTSVVTSVTATNGDYDITYNPEEETIDYSCEIGENGLAAKLAIAGDFMNGEGNIVIDANGIDGKWNFEGSHEYANGSVNYDPANEAFSFKLNASDGRETLKVAIEDDPANDEFVFNLDTNNGYETLKAEIEYVDEELYAALTMTRGSRTMADIVITGSSTYRVKGSWMYDYTNYTINATIRMKNSGCQIEGELGIDRGVIEFNFTEDKANNTETLVLNVTGANPSDKIVAELRHSATNITERVSVIADVTVSGDNMKLSCAAEVNKATGEVKGEFAIDENGSAISGTFLFSNTLIEIKFTDGEANYRLYSEDMSGANNLSVQSGFTAEEIANPGQIVDLILFMMDIAFENGLTFDVNMNNALNGFFASAIFNGQTLKLDVTVDGETVSLEGKVVENENASYLEFTGIVSGLPFEARIGMKMDEAALTLFAEAIANGEKTLDVQARLSETADGFVIEVFGDSVTTPNGEKLAAKFGMAMQSEETILLFAEMAGEVPEHLAGVYLPITVIEDANSILIKAALSLADGQEIMDVGNALLSYEVTADNAKHVSGERMTADMLTDMIMEILNSMNSVY